MEPVALIVQSILSYFISLAAGLHNSAINAVSTATLVPALSGIVVVELDEKYIGGKPRYQQGVVYKRGKGTAKQ